VLRSGALLHCIVVYIWIALDTCGDLAGAAIGFKTESQMISTDFTFSRAIKKVENLDIETLFRYNLNLKF
jgi:hypothetical protein